MRVLVYGVNGVVRLVPRQPVRALRADFAVIGVGTADLSLGRPSLRTGRADFPHPALQSVVSIEAEQPALGLWSS